MSGPAVPPPGSRPGRRALFSGPYDPGLATGEGQPDPAQVRASHPAGAPPAEPVPGRRALFSESARARSASGPSGPAPDPSDIRPGPTTAVVECRTCLNRTPMSIVGLALSMLPSVWLPTRRWPRLMRCPACQRVSWCRIEWPSLRGSD